MRDAVTALGMFKVGFITWKTGQSYGINPDSPVWIAKEWNFPDQLFFLSFVSPADLELWHVLCAPVLL